jgi:hypothetical protein
MNTMQPSNANTLPAEEMTSPATVLGHSALVAEVGVRARDTADRIQMRHRRHIAAVIETGSDLITMKEQLGDELFCSWLQAQRGMNEDIARKYMRLATEFGEKLDIVSDLPLETLYKLTARTTPKSVKSAVLGYLARGQRLAPEEIDRLVREGRRAEERIKRAERAEQEAKLTPQQRARRDARAARRRWTYR